MDFQKNIGRSKLCFFSSKFGQGVRGFVKIIIGVRKLWVNISRNLETGLRGFPYSNGGGRIQEIWRGFAWISRRQY